jgi:TRAP-type C4-dicarboxylate transport system permease small subunit
MMSLLRKESERRDTGIAISVVLIVVTWRSAFHPASAVARPCFALMFVDGYRLVLRDRSENRTHLGTEFLLDVLARATYRVLDLFNCFVLGGRWRLAAKNFSKAALDSRV